MNCTACEKRTANGVTGHYQASCLECCAHLVKSTKPLKAHAAAMLQFLQRFKNAPTREDILTRLKERI